MRRRFVPSMSLASIALLIGLLTAPARAAPGDDDCDAAPPCQPVTGSVEVSFHDAPFTDVLDELEHLTCKRFIVTMAARGPRTVTFSHPTPLVPVDGGRFWKVVDKDRILIATTP